MQKLTPVAIIVGALIIAVALVFHAQRLAEVAQRIQALEQRTDDLDGRLSTFQEELPAVIEQAGNGAGRQAVHGIIDEAFHKPLRKLSPALRRAASNVVATTGDGLDIAELVRERGAPLVQFDIPTPNINIEIVTNLKDLPELPWLTGQTNDPPPAVTNGTATNSQPSRPR